jgi:hypothetical protein
MARLRHTLFAFLQLANAHALLKRAFWVFILVLHVGAIRSTWFVLDGMSDNAEWLSSWFRFLALIGSAVFFALKIADVSWLRLRPGWRSFISSLVIIALLHVNVLDRATKGELSYSPTHLGIVLCVGTLVEFDGLRRAMLRVRGFIAHRLVVLSSPAASYAYFHRLTYLNTLRPPRWLVSTGVLAPRAPPLS